MAENAAHLQARVRLHIRASVLVVLDPESRITGGVSTDCHCPRGCAAAGFGGPSVEVILRGGGVAVNRIFGDLLPAVVHRGVDCAAVDGEQLDCARAQPLQGKTCPVEQKQAGGTSNRIANPHGLARVVSAPETKGLAMRKILSLTALLVLPFVLAGCSHPQPVYAYPPPPAYSAVAQQGYNDGVAAARRDIHQGLQANVERHPRFNNPPVAPPLQEDYRHGFREGYQAVYRGGPGGGY